MLTYPAQAGLIILPVETRTMVGLFSINSAQGLLADYLKEVDRSRSDQLLETLMEKHLFPIISKTIYQKLKQRAPYQENSVAEQVWDKSSVDVLRHIDRVRSGDAEVPESILNYTAMIAFNAVAFVLNEEKSDYQQFRTCVIDTIKRNPQYFALWQELRKRLAASLTYRLVRHRTSPLWESLTNKPGELLTIDPQADSDKLVVVLNRLLNKVTHPVMIEPLVRVLGEALQIQKIIQVELEHEGEESTGRPLPAPDDTAKVVERRRLIDAMLTGMEALDLRRRRVLLLALLEEFQAQTAHLGEDPKDPTSLPRRVQALVELNDEDFGRYWDEGKVSDQQIGDLLQVSPSNVAYLRNDARAKLQKAMERLWG